MSLCKYDDCERDSIRKRKPGYCNGHYKKHLRYGDASISRRGVSRFITDDLIQRNIKNTKKGN